MSTTATDPIETTVVEALTTFGANADDISREATWEDLDVDSLDLAELSQVVEDEHGVTMQGDDMKRIRTVGDAIDFITEKKSAAA
jgi:acyl carrier protein